MIDQGNTRKKSERSFWSIGRLLFISLMMWLSLRPGGGEEGRHDVSILKNYNYFYCCTVGTWVLALAFYVLFVSYLTSLI